MDAQPPPPRHARHPRHHATPPFSHSSPLSSLEQSIGESTHYSLESAPRRRRRKGERSSRPDRPTMEPKHTRQRSSSANGTTIVTSASPFLQNLINEQRAARGSSRPTPSDQTMSNPEPRPKTPTAATSYSQTDLSSEQQRKVNNALAAGLKQPEDMGVREMDQYVHKLNKLNFDLKLDIFHRAQQIASLKSKVEHMHELEEKVQRMERLEEELQDLRAVEDTNQRLRESNEHLQSELDKREQAVSEAVDLICGLEARIEELESDRAPAASSEARENTMPSPESSPESRSSRNRAAVPNVPDRTSSRRCMRSSTSHLSSAATTTTAGHQARRQPSFLRNQQSSTSVLRSVYLADGAKSRTALSAISQSETAPSEVDGHADHQRQRPDSPNLSILSECSYLDPSKSPTRQFRPDLPTITSETVDPTQLRDPKRSPKHSRPDNISRVEQWIQPQHKHAENPSTQTPKNKQTEKSEKRSLAPAFREERPAEKSKLHTPTVYPPVYTNGRFPPTPDTMSTSQANTIRNTSNTSIIAEKSQYDRLYNPLPVGRGPRRPRSADELTTRPSTSSTADDPADAEFNAEADYPLANMFPSYAQESERHSTPLRPQTSEDSKTNGGQHEQVDPNRPGTSKSPPLTPQDWLDAALPSSESKKNDTYTSPQKPLPRTPSKQPENYHEEAGPITPQIDEPELPPAATLRVRAGDTANGSNNRTVSGARKLLSLRLFGRSGNGTNRQPLTADTSTADDKDDPTTPITRIAGRASVSLRRSMNVEFSPSTATSEKQHHGGEDQKPATATRPFTSSARPSTGNRPLTAGSLETGAAGSRRTSHGGGLFGWIRGSGSSKDSEINIASSPGPAGSNFLHNYTTQKNMKSHTRTPMQQGRCVSALGHVSGPYSAYQVSVSGPAPSPDEGRKSRLPPRRFRKG